MRIRFRLGPFSTSQRLGGTQAQKRAAAKARQQRAEARAHARHMALPETQAAIAAAHARIDRTYSGPVTMSDEGKTLTVADSLKGNMTIRAPDDRFSLLHDGDVVRLTPNEDGTALEAFEHLWYANGRSASEKSPLNWIRSEERARLFAEPPDPATVAAREAAKADHDARTRRAVISGCRIDPLKGGSFTLSTADDLEMVFNVAANAALHFLPLKNGDIAQITFNPGKTGLEEFCQLSRANGAKPRSPVELSAADLERYGLAADRRDSRPDAGR
jgi:hypothetical protein